MPALREIIATDLETQQLCDQSQIQSSFEFRVPKDNIPHLLISVIHMSGVPQTTNYCQITITSSNQNLECTDLHSSDSDFEINSPLKTYQPCPCSMGT